MLRAMVFFAPTVLVLGMGAILIACQPKPITPTVQYTHLSIRDCPGGKGLEAVFGNGRYQADGWWFLEVASKAIQVKPPEGCWQALSKMPTDYKGGERLQMTGMASGSAKR